MLRLNPVSKGWGSGFREEAMAAVKKTNDGIDRRRNEPPPFVSTTGNPEAGDYAEFYRHLVKTGEVVERDGVVNYVGGNDTI